MRRILSGSLAAPTPGASLSEAEYDRGLMHAYLRGGKNAAGVAALASLSPGFGRAIEARAARWSSSLTPYDGTMIGHDAIAAALASSPFTGAVSPSRLETYAECPYRYFLRYSLRLDPVEEPEAVEQINALERGSLIHEILEKFLRAICPDDPPSAAARDRHLPQLLALAHDEGRKREQRGVTGNALIWKIHERQIHEDLIRWYDAEVKNGEPAGLTPRGFEVSFGPMPYGRNGDEDPLSTTEPIVVDAGARQIRLQGRIDRIDFDDERTRFRVIDYKTGRASTKETFDHGRALQLPIYLRAAATLLGIDEEEGAAEYFFATGRGDYKRQSFTGEQLAQRRPEFEQVLRTIADGIDGGYFAPNPGKNKAACRYCDYVTICDTRIDRIMDRKKDDPRAAQFIALEEIS